LDATWISDKTPPVAPGAAVHIGDRLGAYRIVSQLGSGGMGTVFVGQHELIGRKVALKVLHPAYALNPEIARRFLQEAQLANSVASENIVEVEDFVSTPEGLCYLVMELLSGSDLAGTVAADGILPLARSLAIVRQVAQALSVAHRERIIHRDLKPENIFLVQGPEKRDAVKLLDFGLAKLNESRVTPESTQVGAVLGTPAFMSPEQALGLNMDHRTDIYSLGIVLYWLLSGELPFKGASLSAQREARKLPAPPLPKKTPTGEPIPAALAELVTECLDPERAARPSAMRFVIERIDAISKTPAVSPAISGGAPVAHERAMTDKAVVAVPTGAPSKPSRRWTLGAAAVATVALLATGGWLFSRQTPVETPAPATPAATAAPTPTVPAPTPPPPVLPTGDQKPQKAPAQHPARHAGSSKERKSRAAAPSPPPPAHATTPELDPFAPLPNR
jgi:serine/threonine-protein kinase